MRVWTVLFVLLPVVARADAATEAKLRDALRATTAQLRSLEEEKSAWAQREAALRKEVEAAKASKPAEPPRREKVVVDRTAVAALEKQLEEERARTRSAQGWLAFCSEQTRDPGPATAAPADRVATLEKQLADSEQRNLEMYKVGKDLLDWLTEIGVGGEPLFGWKKLELEQVAQAYQDKLFDQRVQK